MDVHTMHKSLCPEKNDWIGILLNDNINSLTCKLFELIPKSFKIGEMPVLINQNVNIIGIIRIQN